MSVSRVGSAAAAVTLGGLAVFGLQAPAFATHNCPNPAGHYPPGQCPPKTSVEDPTPVPGQKYKVHGEGFKPGSQVEVYAESTPILLGTFTADSIGVIDAEVTIPLGLSVGAHSIVLTGVSPTGAPLRISTPITVTAANVAIARGGTGAPGGGLGLPATGNEIALVSVTGLALVGVGAGAVIAGRRRRMTDSPA
ncbi:MAG: LPXTG cell wall anchor domain-containing protein [Mycobacteriales bacterium]|nr:LPXTG cell wall anchor domain-containing protein [Mycobacteriales bacterium]